MAGKHAGIRGDHAVRPLGPAERRRGQASARQGDCSLRQVEADPSVPKGGSSQECRTRTAERIENRARTRRQEATDHTDHELLRKYSRIIDTGLRGGLPEVGPYRNGVAEPVTTGQGIGATGRNHARSHQQEGCRRRDKEGARDYRLSGRRALSPSVEIGLRDNRSDAKNRAGTDVRGGLAVTDQAGGLSLEMRIRVLVVHQALGVPGPGTRPPRRSAERDISDILEHRVRGLVRLGVPAGSHHGAP